MAYQLLFVCLGNICRSPSAENIANHLIQKADLTGKIVCDSAGTSSYHLGSPPDRRMNAAATKRGIKLEGRARQFTPLDFEKFDLILAMDRQNYQDILYLDCKFFNVKWFKNIVIGTQFQPLQFVLAGGLCRKHNYRDMAGTLIIFEFFTQCHTIHPGHHYVRNDDIRHGRLRFFQSFNTIPGFND